MPDEREVRRFQLATLTARHAEVITAAPQCCEGLHAHQYKEHFNII
jgi:hypothetical protein